MEEKHRKLIRDIDALTALSARVWDEVWALSGCAGFTNIRDGAMRMALESYRLRRQVGNAVPDLVRKAWEG